MCKNVELIEKKELSNIESVENQDVLVVLGERYDITLGRNLQSATATNFDVRAFKLPDQRTFPLENGDVETISVAISNQNITGIADIYAIWKIRDVLAADSMEELAILIEDHNAMSLHNKQQLWNAGTDIVVATIRNPLMLSLLMLITVPSGSIWFPDQKLI